MSCTLKELESTVRPQHAHKDIIVTTMTCKCIKLGVDSADTIHTVKLRFQDLEGTPSNSQRLVFESEKSYKLEEEHIFAD